MIIAAVGIIMTYRSVDIGSRGWTLGTSGDVIPPPAVATVAALSRCNGSRAGARPSITMSPTSPKSTRYDTRCMVMGVIWLPRRYSPFNVGPSSQ